MAKKTAKEFKDWCSRQVGRNDKVGDIAEDICRDHSYDCEWSLDEVRQHVEEMCGDSEKVMTALTDAIAEFKKSKSNFVELEKTVEARLVRKVKALGGDCPKFVSPSRRGVPDRIVLMPGGKITFVELKSTNGKLMPIQEHEISRLKALGFSVEVLAGREAVDVFVEKLEANHA